ncbi:MAG TPA: response regulator [Nitrospirota bacterium]|nr:response regulator [Nitrospirota bacterium]
MNNPEVLIIDDHGATRDSIRMLLEFEGYIVRSCENGLAAFTLVKEHCFKVLLIGYLMPEMNGDDVTKLLRPLCPDALVIGYSNEKKGKAFLTAGADVFISKDALAHKLIPLIKSKMMP